MKVINGVQMSDAFYDRIVSGDFESLDITKLKEKQAVVKICADNGIPIKVLPLGGNVHRIIRVEKVCPNCGGKGYI